MDNKPKKILTLPQPHLNAIARVYIIISDKLFEETIKLKLKMYFKTQFGTYGKEHLKIMKKYNTYLFSGEFNSIFLVKDEKHYHMLYLKLTEKKSNDLQLMVQGLMNTQNVPLVDLYFVKLYKHHLDAHKACAQAIYKKVKSGAKWKEGIGLKKLAEAENIDIWQELAKQYSPSKILNYDILNPDDTV